MGKQPENFKLRYIKLAELKPAPYNPKRIGTANLDALHESVQRFGCVEPIVWNKRTGHIVGGHSRVEVLRRESADTVPVIAVDLPLEEEKALNLSLSNPLLQGGFEDESLQALLEELNGVLSPAEMETLRMLELAPEELEAYDSSDIDLPEKVTTTTTREGAAAAADGPPEEVAPVWRVTVKCGSSAEALQLHEELTKRGYECLTEVN